MRNKSAETMVKVNLSLPAQLWKAVKQTVKKGEYSQFMSRAIEQQLSMERHNEGKKKLLALMGTMEIPEDHPWYDLKKFDEIVERERE